MKKKMKEDMKISEEKMNFNKNYNFTNIKGTLLY